MRFLSHPPLSDTSLKEKIMRHTEGDPLHIKFSPDVSTELTTMKRVVSAASDMGIEVRHMEIPALLLLSAYEPTTPERPSNPDLLGDLRTVSASVHYQRAPRQMGELTALLARSSLREARLTLHQHRTEAFLREDPKIIAENRKYGEENLSFLKSLPGLPTPAEKRIAQEACLNQRISRACIEHFGGKYIPKEVPVDREVLQLQSEIMQSLMAEEVEGGLGGLSLVAPSDPPPPVQVPQSAARHLDVILSNPGGYAVTARLPEGQYLSAEDEDATLDAFLSTPLPDTLQALHLKVRAPRDFASRHTRFLAPGLVVLELNYCDLTDAAMEFLARSIGELRGLRKLDLERNRLVHSLALHHLVGPSLEAISLALNPLTGPAVSNFLTALHGNSVLRLVNLEGTDPRNGHLSVDNLDLWAAPNPHLRFPACLDDAQIEAVSTLMPDGGTLELIGVSRLAEVRGGDAMMIGN